ncbi:PREDICTED: uncharacterized protein LOC101374892 [Odobenus rosmarus divergens]|uniref:Uncharacterized protein LOC101374892 n=1 Tax=Odobenus rosmarus divergens TaxID=9708 RepID=A0A2U3W5G1_ODORO|nr:PREDICTED: uncharacterized protein LOC101374892 [Odobenus rosmarus divergens]
MPPAGYPSLSLQKSMDDMEGRLVDTPSISSTEGVVVHRRVVQEPEPTEAEPEAAPPLEELEPAPTPSAALEGGVVPAATSGGDQEPAVPAAPLPLSVLLFLPLTQFLPWILPLSEPLSLTQILPLLLPLSILLPELLPLPPPLPVLLFLPLTQRAPDPSSRPERGLRSRRDNSRTSWEPDVDASGGRGAASTRTGALPPQDPLRRLLEDTGRRPQGQEPGLLGLAVEASRGHGAASTLTASRPPRDPLKAPHFLREVDYLVCREVDVKFRDHVSMEILSPLFGTPHSGFYWAAHKDFSYEHWPRSQVHTPRDKGDFYYMGTFFGGSVVEVHRLTLACHQEMRVDLASGIEVVWHLNRCLLDHKPLKVLSPEDLWDLQVLGWPPLLGEIGAAGPEIRHLLV